MEAFHPLVQKWFRSAIGTPTSIQEQAWPRIASNDNLLICAPTGSGKTLAAFLWALNSLLTRERPIPSTRILYISPLKALNNDIQRNLLRPLQDLQSLFNSNGTPFPSISVQTRSGDTSTADRRRMLKHPPEILITTPESLNLMINSPRFQPTLSTIETVILDEIHSVFNSKRGVHLMTAIERLVMSAGEFQRIALSATIRPLEPVARFIGGFELLGNPRSPSYRPRPVTVLKSDEVKQYEIQIEYTDPADRSADTDIWDDAAARLKRIISRNTSTLIFVNSRRLAEKLTMRINRDEAIPLAYAHHGSLSREIRTEVERKLKEGELKAVIATHSLELGIDIGWVDETVLVQAPSSIGSAIQRIGRAGHQVGMPSRAVIMPVYPHDLLESTVLSRKIQSQDIEPSKPVESPLDILAQTIVSMTALETWDIDELFYRIRSCSCYQTLMREEYNRVIEMLGGRYDDSRIRELRARVSIDREKNTVAGLPCARQLIYRSGGTIPDRGYFKMRLADSKSPIGELDEEFVWEARIGQTFALGTQSWKIDRITHNDVFVSQGRSTVQNIPFWKAEEILRDMHYAGAISEFLEMAEYAIETPEFADRLTSEYGMESKSAEKLIQYLQDQRRSTGKPLPHRRHLLMERIRTGPGGAPGNQVALHTFWGGRLNRPFALALAAAWEERFGGYLETFSNNNLIVLVLPDEIVAAELFGMVPSGDLTRLLRKSLEKSGFFGARFRENAGRALMLTRNRMMQRTPLWMNRLKSQKLLASVMNHTDFPLLTETWRTCLQDEFDLEGLTAMLKEIETGAIRISECSTPNASPFAETIVWRQVNQYVYIDDDPPVKKESALRTDIIEQVAQTSGMRLPIPLELADAFDRKLKRLASGYAPQNSRELLDWLKDRLVMPEAEWNELLAAMETDIGGMGREMREEIADRLQRYQAHAGGETLWIASERFPKISGILEANAKESEDEIADEGLRWLVGEWLAYYGPVRPDFVARALNASPRRLDRALQKLAHSSQVVMGELISGDASLYVCDYRNYERLLRLLRVARRPDFEPLDEKYLQVFFATIHGLGRRGANEKDFEAAMERLAGYACDATFWFTEIFPARFDRFDTGWVDKLIQTRRLRWLGAGFRRIRFGFPEDAELLAAGSEEEDAVTRLFADPNAKYDFAALLRVSNLGPEELSDLLWRGVWSGNISNDSFEALKTGIETEFESRSAWQREKRVLEMMGPMGRRNRTGRGIRVGWRGRGKAFDQWRHSMPFSGNWFRVQEEPAPQDAVEAEEIRKDRVRVLLGRRGLLFRACLEDEPDGFKWKDLFRTMQLMELSGEIASGCFFRGVQGIQFISQENLELLRAGLDESRIFWINATDPGSTAGLGLGIPHLDNIKRQVSTHLVFEGGRLAIASHAGGRRLEIFAAPHELEDEIFFEWLKRMMTRKMLPTNPVRVETINGEDAAQSEYLPLIRRFFNCSTGMRDVMISYDG